MMYKHTLILMRIIFGLLFVFFHGALGTSITVVNNCNFTVWPGISGEPVLNITGFELTKGTSRSFQAPMNWTGHIWGRTACRLNGSGHWSCSTGDCGTGAVECNGQSYKPPVTIAEINTRNYRDSYDVSIMNGFNLPMTVQLTSRQFLYKKMGCVNDLNRECPPKLQLEDGGGCMSACQVYPFSPEYCCNNDVRMCTPTSYGQLFHSVCPKSVTYEYDRSDSMVVTEGGDDYNVIFCDTFSTIKRGSQLTYTDQLVSHNGSFILGFFNTIRSFDELSSFDTIRSSDEDGSYLGIWYANDVESKKVWVANPNNPVKSTSGHALSVDPKTGNLIIIDGSRILMTITNIDAGPNPNVTATLEENGNFRLINENDKRVLWQSFDYPTSVLLPGMKLGYDLSTGQNWTLTSWLSNEIPDAGAFTLSWEPINETSHGLMIRRQGQPYWTSENLDNQTFQNIFAASGYRLTTVYNNKERLISYYQDSHFARVDGTFPMWLLTPEGQIDGGVYSPWVPKFCYGFQSRMGCVDSSLPLCRMETDIFTYRNGDFTSHQISNATDSNLSLSISDCPIKCWNDCTCVGFNSSNTNGTGCIFWRGNNSFSDDPRESSAWMYVISHQNPTAEIKPKNKRKLVKILIGTIIPLIVLPLGFLWYLKKRELQKEEEEKQKRDKYVRELTASESFKGVHQLGGNGGKGNDLLIFSFESIIAATNDFSIKNKLGQGGFGPVYKGQLNDGQEIAIKRLSRTSGQGHVEFKNELILIAKLQHTNLVRVLGCCIHKEENQQKFRFFPLWYAIFFIYEYRKVELDWPKRFNIIEGIAQGLLYLHKYSRMRVIHRDLKANNILLDENMNPKIADFGMARMFKQNETHAMTNRVVGTFGYMPPEYVLEGTFSIKSDIFSFGVLILEIVSGRKNTSFIHLDRTINLIGYAWELWQQGNTWELEDTTLRNTCDVQQFLRTVHVALLCVQESATDRPTTSDMISMLLNDTVPLPAPSKPAFFTTKVESESTSQESKPKHDSINNMTITAMAGR